MTVTTKTLGLEQVLDIVVAFNSVSDYYELLHVIVTQMMSMTNADGGTLYVVDGDKLHYKIIINKSLEIMQGARDESGFAPIPLDESNIENISAYAALKNEIVSVDDVYEDAVFDFNGPKKFDASTGYHTVSMLVFPLTATSNETQEVVGVIQLINAIDVEDGKIIPFRSVYNAGILRAVSNIAANALANILYARDIDELLQSFVRVMTKAIDERSVYNVNHTKHVAQYCERFTEYLNARFPPEHELHFNKNRMDQLVMAAYLHDIGKIITPLEIMDKQDRLAGQREIIGYKMDIKRQQIENELLRGEITESEYNAAVDMLDDAVKLIDECNIASFLPDEKLEQIQKLAELTYINREGKTETVLTSANLVSLTVRKGTLTDAEREIMQEHASITSRLLDNMTFNKYYKDVSRWAAGHHECPDGSGYPLGISGDAVETEMCILSIIDVFDALTASDRPYKRAVPLDKSADILISMAEEGKLKRELVDLFIESKAWE